MASVNWLYHYTNKEGYEGILASQTIRASTIEEKRNTHYGKGVYLTDLNPNDFKHLGDGNCIEWLFNRVNGYAVEKTCYVICFSRDGILDANIELEEMVDRPEYGHIWLVPGEGGLSLPGLVAEDNCGPTEINRRVEEEMTTKGVDRGRAAGNYAYRVKRKGGNIGVYPVNGFDDEDIWPEVPMEDRLRFSDPEDPPYVKQVPVNDGSCRMLTYIWDHKTREYVLQP